MKLTSGLFGTIARLKNKTSIQRRRNHDSNRFQWPFFSGSKEELVRFIIQSVGVTAIEYDTNRFQPLSMTFIFWWLKKERFGLLLRFTWIYHRLGMTSSLALTVNWLGSLYRKWLSLCSHYDTYDFGWIFEWLNNSNVNHMFFLFTN